MILTIKSWTTLTLTSKGYLEKGSIRKIQHSFDLPSNREIICVYSRMIVSGRIIRLVAARSLGTNLILRLLQG